MYSSATLGLYDDLEVESTDADHVVGGDSGYWTGYWTWNTSAHTWTWTWIWVSDSGGHITS